jgi:hypothetical protein
MDMAIVESPLYLLPWGMTCLSDLGHSFQEGGETGNQIGMGATLLWVHKYHWPFVRYQLGVMPPSDCHRDSVRLLLFIL